MNADTSHNSLSGRKFRLRGYLIRPELNRIEHGQTSVTVEPRVMDVLVYLAERAGKVVSREQLLDELWGEAVVVEHALTRVISELRRLLGDEPERPLFIETIRKRGYRLVAPVAMVPEEHEESLPLIETIHESLQEPAAEAACAAIPSVTERTTPITPVPIPSSSEFPKCQAPVAVPPAAAAQAVPADVPARSMAAPRVQGDGRAPRRILLVAALLALAMLAVRFGRDRINPSRPVVLATVPFTSYAGSEQMPCLSPDGTRVAFSWDGADRNNVDIYVKQRGAEVPLRLTTDPNHDGYPVWSPDGANIAFVRQGGGEVGIWTVPAIGGVERRLHHAVSRIDGIDWSPDGGTIVFSEQTDPEGYSRLKSLELESLEVSALGIPSPQRSDVAPAVSPDGRLLAFVRQNPAGYKQICLMPVSGGNAEALTQEMRILYGFSWRNNNKEIVFTSPSAGASDLWQVSLERRSIIPLVVREPWLARLSCARRGVGMICETWTCDSDVWEIRVDRRDRVEAKTVALIRSTRWDGYPRMSPDDRRVAFASGRSGRSEIWMCDRDGGRPVQLTSLDGLSIGSSICWSADGEEISYTTSPEGYACIFVVGVDGGRAKRLSFDRCHEQVCDWSADGEWIYFSSDRESGWQIWKMRPDGRDRTRITRGGGIEAFESSDSQWLYFVRPEGRSVLRVPVVGGEERVVLELPSRLLRSGWIVRDEDVYYFGSGDRGYVLSRRAIHGGEEMELVSIRGTPGPGIEVSEDGTSVLYARADDNVADLVLVEGYR